VEVVADRQWRNGLWIRSYAANRHYASLYIIVKISYCDNSFAGRGVSKTNQRLDEDDYKAVWSQMHRLGSVIE